MKPLELLKGTCEGLHAALIGAGPSLDFAAPTQGDHDVAIGMNEAILHCPWIGVLTCFDQKAVAKTSHAWSWDLNVICTTPSAVRGLPGFHFLHADERLTQAHAGSLGLALGLCKWMGFAKVDLYGVDLCWIGEPVSGKYSSKIRESVKRQTYGGFSFHRVRVPGRETISNDDPWELWTDGAFERFAREVGNFRHEWEEMEVRNCSPISQLDCFPRLVEA